MSILLSILMLSGWPVVLDGDTIVLDGTHIRIANIDAPEIGHHKCDAELRLGLVAKRRMVELLNSGPVTIHPGDPKDGRLKDRYGRTLATIEVDGRDIGKIMIAEWLARPWLGKRQPWCD
jgi:endonuclease YncB( thermonuclease family)